MTAAPASLPASSPVPAPRFDARLFAAGMTSFLLVGSLAAVYGVGLPVWSRAFGLGPGEGGLLLSAQGAGALLTVLAGVAGLPVLSLRAGLLVHAAGSALLGLAPSWGGALLGAVLSGAGFGLVVQVVNRRFLTGFGPRGPGMVGLVNAVFGAGAIVAPLAVLLAGGRPGPVLLAVAALLALAAFLAPPEPADDAPPRGLPPLGDARLLLLLPILLTVALEGALMGFGASALIDRGLPPEAAARLVSGFFAAYLAGRLSLWWVAARVPPGALFLTGIAGTAAAAAAATAWPAAGYVAAGAFIGIAWPAFYVWASRLLGADPRMGSAVLAASILGSILGPLALRPVLAATGEGGVFAAAAAGAGGLALVVALLLPRLGRLAPR